MLAPKAKGGKGQPITITFPNVGTFDPATQSMSGGGAPSVNDGSGIELSFDIRQIDGKSILQDDKRFLLSPKKLDGTDMPEPTTKATVTLADGPFRIINCKPTKPAGVAIMYELQLRK